MPLDEVPVIEDEPRLVPTVVVVVWERPKAPWGVELDIEDVLTTLLMGIGAGLSSPAAAKPKERRLVTASDCWQKKVVSCIAKIQNIKYIRSEEEDGDGMRQSAGTPWEEMGKVSDLLQLFFLGLFNKNTQFGSSNMSRFVCHITRSPPFVTQKSMSDGVFSS